MKKFLISIYFASILFSMPQLDANAITEHLWNHKGKYFLGAVGFAGFYLLKSEKKYSGKIVSRVKNILSYEGRGKSIEGDKYSKTDDSEPGI